ncbi:MAG: hypothetical protein MZU97_14890 [Bacillus subtilis]|nr:hypothetical protein [Bacillus subtilis]
MEALKDWAYGLQALTLRPEVWGMKEEPEHEEEAPDDVTELSTSWGIIMALAYPEHIAGNIQKAVFDPETNKEDMTFQATLFALPAGSEFKPSRNMLRIRRRHFPEACPG